MSNDEQMREFQEAFAQYDSNGRNQIRSQDLAAVLRALGQNLSQKVHPVSS